jgi:hypothetical protein
MTDERRRFFRIDDTVGLKAERIDPKEVEEKIEHFRQNKHQYAMLNDYNFQLEQHQADLRKITERMPELGRYLKMLQQQIDRLTEQLLPDDQQFVDRELPVNISAQGIAFYSSESADPGDVIELHLKLHPSQHRIMVLARVIHCESDRKHPGQYRIALDFEHIREADRELLVKHVHGRQLQALGASRYDNEPG